AFEHLVIQFGRVIRIRNLRLAQQHQKRLAPDICSFVIVPSILRRDDPITGKDDVGILRCDLRYRPWRQGCIIFREPQSQRLAACYKRSGGPGSNPDKWNYLNISAIWIAGLEAELLKLLDQVIDRQFFTARARRAAFELIGGQHLNVSQQLLARYAGEGGLHFRRWRESAFRTLATGECERNQGD